MTHAAGKNEGLLIELWVAKSFRSLILQASWEQALLV